MTSKLKNWLLTSSQRILRILVFVFGGIGAFGFAPLLLTPCLFIAFVGSVVILGHTTNHKQAFWLGWWFGLGYFIVGLYWIAFALGVDLNQFGWLIPFAVMGLPAILAFFSATAFYLTSYSRVNTIVGSIVFSCAWVGMEWLRGHLFTGFPWNLVGYTWAWNLPLIQSVAFIGVYGLSLLTVLGAAVIPLLYQGTKSEKTISFLILCIFPLMWLFGSYRLSHPMLLKQDQTTWLRIVQPDIKQSLKWDPVQKEKNFQRLLHLSSSPAQKPLRIIIWPETAIPFFLAQDAYLRQVIAETLPDRAILITGSPRRTQPGITPIQIWNSLLVMDKNGRILASYDKSHLAPFGEYVPLRKYLDQLMDTSFLKKLTAGSIDFTAGLGPQTITIEHLPPFSPLICYEGIFPTEVINPNENRPEWLLNLTNDAWFGDSAGPYQHLQIVRMRAIEEGIPLIRSANSGISAVFDSYGRLVDSMALHQAGWIDVELPSPLAYPPLYARFGDGILAMILIFLLGSASLAGLTNYNNRKYYLRKIKASLSFARI